MKTRGRRCPCSSAVVSQPGQKDGLVYAGCKFEWAAPGHRASAELQHGHNPMRICNLKMSLPLSSSPKDQPLHQKAKDVGRASNLACWCAGK